MFNKKNYEICVSKICEKQIEIIERVFDRLTAVSNNSSHLRNVVDDLLDLSELSNNRMKLNLQTFNFYKLVVDVVMNVVFTTLLIR